ncbi:GH36 C-terminal domain-containing protein [Streptomyces sp. NPDC085596]|uniref:GH36 C-terminal domain-containing protein n=1 Tax=Streptomyces sp. NPDC085596 TaxID=3365731 RepID=UPI0037D10786
MLIRPLVRHGHQYRLLAPGEGALTAVQYVDPDADRTVVLVWRPSAFFGPAHPPLRLRGLDPGARYRDEDTGAEWSGATLAGFGLTIPGLPDGDCASALVRLRRVV